MLFLLVLIQFGRFYREHADAAATGGIGGVAGVIREPPKTTFWSWVKGWSSVFGAEHFKAASPVGVFLTVNLL